MAVTKTTGTVPVAVPFTTGDKMTELTDVMDDLSKPFDPSRVEWKPQATRGDRGLAIAFADPRTYQDRLNQVAGSDWSDDYQVLDGGAVVLCKLTVCGVTRSDIGEAPKGDRNTGTSALAQAFKRAAVKFGVGRYLYDLPKTWVDYDPERKRITPEGQRKLAAVLAGGEIERSAPRTTAAPSGNGNGNADATTFWTLYNERAHERVSRDQAQEWAEAGDWEEAIERLRGASTS